jgi:hypothetical protein
VGFLMSNWNLNLSAINGYPYPITPETDIGNPLNFDDNFFKYIWSGETLGWKFENSVLNGYPHIKYRALNPPVHQPLITSMTIERKLHFMGLEADLLVELGIRHLKATDKIVLEIKNSVNHLVWNTEFSSQEARQQTVIHAIPGNIMKGLEIENYSIVTYIRREGNESPAVSTTLEVVELPYIEAVSLSPTLIALPVSSENNQVAIDYTINGQGIESVKNNFAIADNSVSKTVCATEFLEIQSATPTTAFFNASFNFQVTDPDFKLISFRFRFNQHNSSTEVRYNLNGTNILSVPRPSNSPTTWVEWVAPEPRHLPMGANTIQVTNGFGNFVMFSTNNRPTVPGMNITSTTVWAMEMAYSISSSSIELGEIKTATLIIDDGISMGNHPLIIETDMKLEGFENHVTELNTDLFLRVVDSPALENTYVSPDALTTLSPPTTIETKWKMNAEFLVGESFSIIGEIKIEGTGFLSAINTDNNEFTVAFSDVLLPAGNYSFNYNLIVSHEKYGNFPISGSVANMLFVELILPPPQIISAELSHSGRYIGAEIEIGVTASLSEIVNGDSIEIVLKSDDEIFYTHSNVLGESELLHSHTIPAEYFTNLSTGEYIIENKQRFLRYFVSIQPNIPSNRVSFS